MKRLRSNIVFVGLLLLVLLAVAIQEVSSERGAKEPSPSALLEATPQGREHPELEAIRRNARRVLESASEERQSSLPYDSEAVAWVDEHIRRFGKGLTEEEQEQLATALGCLVGEVAVRSYGGEWVFEDEGGWLVRLHPGLKVDPFQAVLQNLKQGEEQSIARQFQIWGSAKSLQELVEPLQEDGTLEWGAMDGD